jgi:hypothetical protein
LRETGQRHVDASGAEAVAYNIHLNGIRIAGLKGKRHLFNHGRFCLTVFRSQVSGDEDGEQK